MNSRISSLARAATAMATAALAAGCGGGNDSAPAQISVVSSRAQYVSGGSALVRITLPTGVPAEGQQISVNGRNVTADFKSATDGKGGLMGLVTGLPDGGSRITVSGPGVADSSLDLTSYPITGPILSGPQDQTFVCQTAKFFPAVNTRVNVQTPVDGIPALGAPLDAKCSIAPRVNYIYRTTGGEWKALASTQAVPSDAATTTTTTGVRMPFVVRIDTRTINRGIYQSAVLFDPTSDAAPSPFSPPKGWNRRLVTMHGFGCAGGWYIQGAALGNVSNAGSSEVTLLDPIRLGQGYAVFSNTLQHPTNNCNALLGAETAMMSKEAFVKQFGPVAWTLSHGFSGGSFSSTRYTDIVPGLFDGLLISSTFPDPETVGLAGQDAHLVRQYAAKNPGTLTDAQIAAVTGFKSVAAMVDVANRAGTVDPVGGRTGVLPGYTSAIFNADVPVAERYAPTANRGGLRVAWDWMRNVTGVNPTTGFARRPYDNVGVQYGLRALNSGAITPDQFLDLNERIGGYDQDANLVAERSVGDTLAIRRLKQSGVLLGGSGGLASIPVLNIGFTVEDAGYHYAVFQFATRERLREAVGNADNFVMWRGYAPYDLGFETLAQWIDRSLADAGTGSQRDKVVRSKPAAAVDGCYDTAGKFIAEGQTLSQAPNSACNTLFPSWEATRIVAGGPVSMSNVKCELKAVSGADYTAAFSAAQMTRLRAVFPLGVCDWSRPGVGQVAITPLSSAGPAPQNPLPTN